MTDLAPQHAPARPMRIGLYAAAVVAGVALVWVGLRFVSGGSPSASPSAAGTSSASQTPQVGVSASAIASIAVSFGPAPSLSPERTPVPIRETGTDLVWERVATFGGAPNVIVLDVAKGPGGYVAVGERIDGVITELGAEGPISPLLWRSADGITWTEGSASAFGSGFATSLASDGAEYLAVVQQDPVTHLFVSHDGVAWQIVANPPSVSDGDVWNVISGPHGFVAIGALRGSGHAAFWSSANGADWTLARQETDNSEVLDVAAGAKGVVAVGIAQPDHGGPVSQAVWYSADGLSWVRKDPRPVGHGILEAIAATSDGFFAAGWLDQVGIEIWHSADGTNWTPLPVPAVLGPDYSGDSGSAGGAFSFAGDEYVTGYASCCGFPFQHTYVSTDGTHWARVHRDAAFAPVHLGTVVVEGDRVVAPGNVLGSGGLGETGGIWIGRVH